MVTNPFGNRNFMQPMRNAFNLWKIYCISEDALCFHFDVVHGMAIDL
jgi:hypothetical protein